MNQKELSDGTGLRDVFDILVNVPPEQVLSLTFQLEESPEDNIIHALCLIILRKEEQALDKLGLLGDHDLAKHLGELWKKSQGRLEDFAQCCGESRQLTGESLAALARVFKILFKHRLCDQILRNLAYKRALSSDSSGEDLLYDSLREEAKNVCGPQLAVWMCSSRDLKSDSYHDAPDSLVEGVTNQVRGFPSTLQSSCSELSFPTHLEISLPVTVPYVEDKMTPEAPGNPEQSLITPAGSDNSPEQSQLSSVLSQPTCSKLPTTDVASQSEHIKNMDFTKKEPLSQSTLPTMVLSSLASATNSILPKSTVSLEIDKAESAEEEDEEVIFYSFVILHAPEDAEAAEIMKEKLETVIGHKGATFSEDFAIPGMSTLKCVEDAINNSAFTLLLLTRNFNTRMLEVKTNSALINSINKQHKHNTVIPVLPKDNRMPKHKLPIVLQTLVPLEESKCFENKIKKALSSAKINNQKRIWSEEQRTRNEHEAAHMLGKLNIVRHPVDVPSAESVWQHHPSIHIENAKYIMIGNDSQMTVDYCGVAEKDNSIVTDDRK
uniref:TIR domain-containing adapter molecule 1 n=1 Tax=Doryrhamphus excisus TaxID=161450 RepID=UPI0025AE5519|nr:TIR domain-containing adapter molecule 1 [Doryrhamphus excisus]